jgi:hypothetical protein
MGSRIAPERRSQGGQKRTKSNSSHSRSGSKSGSK